MNPPPRGRQTGGLRGRGPGGARRGQGAGLCRAGESPNPSPQPRRRPRASGRPGRGSLKFAAGARPPRSPPGTFWRLQPARGWLGRLHAGRGDAPLAAELRILLLSSLPTTHSSAAHAHLASDMDVSPAEMMHVKPTPSTSGFFSLSFFFPHFPFRFDFIFSSERNPPHINLDLGR